ncbi:MAG: adenylate/guanylate cyclase domain-containing protein [Chloroflexota bacterium]|nr:adenylate/guanylate cyclase domain-containing protein [Chloroflexota bacterium]
MEPQFRFCTSTDGTRIAYAVYGSGPPLLYVNGFTRSMEAYFTVPESRAYFDALAAHTRIVTFDRRGTGASARDVDDISFEADARDIAAVAAAAGLADFALFSDSTAGACLHYAIAGQGQARQLVLWTPSVDNARFREMARLCREDWSAARRRMAGTFFPDGPVSLQRTLSQNIKGTVTADVAARYWERGASQDLAPLLPRVMVPTMVLLRETRPRHDAMRVAGLLPNGQLRLVPGTSDGPYPGHEPIVKTVVEFMGLGEIASAPPPHGTAIILFTDIVDSTALTERMGDSAFRAASRALDESVRAAMQEFGGTPVEGKVLGDGVMGVFASAAQAIDAARRCVELSAGLELPMHIGLHAGDVIREDNNVYGGAVNIASRICGLCEPGEILVSQTVRDLARTSAGVTFEDRGEHALKGVADPVRVFAVRPASG